MMVALPAEVYCLLGELKAAVGSFLHFPHFLHFPQFLHFHVHTAAGSSLLNTPAMFPTFSGYCPYSGCSQHFHVFSHNSQHLMFPSPSYAGDSSYILKFYIIYFSVVSVVLCRVLMGRQQISLTWIKIPSGRVKRIWPHHTVCGGGIYIHHTGASKDIYTATTHCLNLKVTESRILYLLLNSIHQERPSRKQDKVWSPYRPCQVTHMWQTPL